MFDRYIAFTAHQMPDLIAVSDGRRQITYRELDRAIDGVAALIADALGDDRTGVVGIATADGYRHSLLALACARLGIASASLFAGQAAAMAAIAGVTLLLCDDPAARGMTIDADWFARAEGRTPPPARAIDPTALARIHFSSGSTGVPKAVEISWRAYDLRIHTGVVGDAAGTRRMLSLIAPESGGLQTMLSTWKHRGCVLFGPSAVEALAVTLPMLAPASLVASPAQLTALLGALPPDMPPLPGLTLQIAGGRLPRAAAERAAIRLGAVVTVVYASSEGGLTALGYASTMADDRAVGFVAPGARVEIVDEQGRPVPPGTVGEVRVTSTEMADGYRGGSDDPCFAGGWFRPGDLGALSADGLLRIIGRVDEVMNVGGEKFLPDPIEDKVRAVAGVADVAVFALEDDASGATQIWLAIVRDGEVDEGAVARAVAAPGLPSVRLAWIEAIPRTLLGKVRREELRTAARALAAQQAGTAANLVE